MEHLNRWKQILEKERRYNEKSYQRLISGLAGWSITAIAFIVWLIKWYVLN